jgi:hypothetical protein
MLREVMLAVPTECRWVSDGWLYYILFLSDEVAVRKDSSNLPWYLRA